jgi:hypothetical protein
MYRPIQVFSAVATLLTLSLAAAPPAAADLLTVVPGGFADTGGGFQSPAPLRFTGIGGGTGGSRTQQVYDSDLFTNFVGPRAITGIDLRTYPGASVSAFFGNSVTASNIVISLSTTLAGDEGDALSSIFANNIGADAKSVYKGALTLTTSANGSLPVSPFDYSIVFQNPFTYDPQKGNLLVDVNIPADATITASGLFGFDTFDTVDAPNDGVSSVFNGTDGNAVSGTPDTSAPILRVHSDALAVPEPSALVLFVTGLLVLAVRRRNAVAALNVS